MRAWIASVGLYANECAESDDVISLTRDIRRRRVLELM